MKFGFTTGIDSMFFSVLPNRLTVVDHDESCEAIHCLEPTFLLKALFHHLDWAVTILLLVCQELERMDQVVANSSRRSVCSEHFCLLAVRAVLYDQDSVRDLPILLTAARHQL